MSPRWSTIVAALSLLGCDGAVESATHTGDVEVAPLVAPVWAGCEDLDDAGCVLFVAPSTTLRVWLDRPPSAALAVAVDGVAVEAATVAADGGTLARVPIPADARAVTLHGPGVDDRLEILWHRPNASLAAARAAFGKGDVERGCAALATVPTDADALDRTPALMQQALRCGDVDDEPRKVAILTKAADLAAAQGRDKWSVGAAAVMLFMCTERGRDRKCAAACELRLAGPWAPELDVWAAYSRGLAAADRGDLDAAIRLFEASERWAERLGMEGDFDAALQGRTVVLAELGRVDAARAAAARLYASAGGRSDPCVRAQLINNAAWPLQVLAEAGQVDDAPIDWMLEEVEIYEGAGCDDPRGRLDARINLASALLVDGDVEGAAGWLSQIRADETPPVGELLREVDYLAVNVALAANRWDIAPVPLLAGALPYDDARLRWRATAQQARLLERFAMDDAALDAWHRAESILDAELVGLGVAQGRESFVSARWSSATGLVEALLRAGRVDEAMCRIRLARGRALRSIDRASGGDRRRELAEFDAFAELSAELDDEAATDWEHAADERVRRSARREQRRRDALARVGRPAATVDPTTFDCTMLEPRRADEVLLAIYPTADDTIVIAQGDGATRLARAPPIPGPRADALEWATEVVDRFRVELRDAATLRVLPVGAAWTVPLHGTQVEDGWLVDRVAVTYGLDLPQRVSTVSTGRAVVVADPSGNLPHARREQALVASALRATDWQVTVLEGAAAERSPVLAAMGSADLFHYAGHGTGRGGDGWGGGATIEPADVLALPRAPRVGVLIGCETGAVRSALLDGGMSLGRAFLLAGGEAVVVGDRDVDDAESVAFAEALYDRAAPPGAFDVVAEVRHAYQGRARAGAPLHGWSGFRVLVR